MFVTREFIEEVGLMEESYFLYFEEIDWAERGNGRFDLGINPVSVVYHHGGASIGTPSERGQRGMRSEYYLLRNRLVFARRFYKARMLTVYGAFILSISSRVFRRQWLRAYIAVCAMLGCKPRGLV